MKTKLFVRLTTSVLICASIVLLARPAEAQAPNPISGAVVAGAIAWLIPAAAAVGIGFLVYYGVRSSHTIKGCVSSAPGGLQLLDEGSKQPYMLLGITSDVKSGERMKLKGKRHKMKKTGDRSFLTERMTKDYGPCKVAPATP